MRQSMPIPLTPLVRFTHSAKTFGGPLLSLRTISTHKINFSTGVQEPDEATGDAKGAGPARVEIGTLSPLAHFTRSAQTSGGPLLSLRTISTFRSNFSTGAKRFDEVIGAAKCAGLSKVEVPMYVLDIWKEERAQEREERAQERAQLLAGQCRIMAEKEENAVKSAIIITELKMSALRLLEDGLRLKESFNVRGGLERITYQAVTEGLIHSEIRGVQAQLDSLSKNTDFVSIYNHEIEAGRLRHADVERCRKSLYHEVSKHAHGNDEVITIRAADFVPTELAALISYYKLQDGWGNCLKWQVIKRDPEVT